MTRSFLTLLSPLLTVLDPARAQRRANARWSAATPDRDHRIDGQARPADVSDPDDVPLRDPAPSLRERVASAMVGAGVSVVRPKKGDVVVLRTDLPMEGLTSFVERMWRDHGALVVVLPTDCRVHAEPAAKPREDLGYRETKNNAVDADAKPQKASAAPLLALPQPAPGFRWSTPDEFGYVSLRYRGSECYGSQVQFNDYTGALAALRAHGADPDSDGETGKQVCGAEKASG